MSKTTLSLILILTLAIFLRFWALDFGLPYFLIDDERALVYGALKMGELKTLIPAWHPEEFSILNYKYNLLMPYIYLIFLTPFMLIQYFVGSFSSFSELANYFILNPTSMWLLARGVNALMGVATVYLIYLTGKKAYNSWVGLISALFLTFSFLHIQYSHFTRPWVPMVFFTCLVALSAVYIYQSPQRKYYLLMGLALGLAAGVSLANAVVIAIFFLTHFILKKGALFEKLKDRNLWTALAVFGFLAAVFLLINPQRSLALNFGSSNLIEIKSIGSYFQGFASYLKVLFFYEPVVSILSLIGLFVFWFKSKKTLLIFLFWPTFYISILYLFSFKEFSLSIPRYLMLIIPWMIVFASLIVYRFVAMFRSSFIRTIILVLIFIYPLTLAVRYDYLLSQKETRIVAEKWVEENIPSGAKIISNWNFVNPVPAKKAILLQKQIDEKSLRAQDNVLLGVSDENYPQPAYDILKIAYIKEGTKLLPLQGYQYFLVAFWNEEDLSREELLMIEKARLIKEFKQGRTEKIESINGDFIRPISIIFSLERIGPTIRIYRL